VGPANVEGFPLFPLDRGEEGPGTPPAPAPTVTGKVPVPIGMVPVLYPPAPPPPEVPPPPDPPPAITRYSIFLVPEFTTKDPGEVKV
jgi:hypothetical protein